MHADRTNRIGLTLFAVLLLAAGVLGALAGFGVLGHRGKHATLLDNRVGQYFGEHGEWLWPVVGIVALVIVLLSLWWLWTLLFSTDRAGELRISGDRSAGRTTLAPAAFTDAVAAEVSNYLGVDSARARLLGDSSSPRLVITATFQDSTDVAALRRRIENDAARHARDALEIPELPVQLDLTVTARQGSRVS